MSPYKLIKGSDKNMAAFEEQIAKAMEEGYDLANDLVTQLKTNANGEIEVLFFQAMINDEELEYEDEDEEDEDEEDEEVDEYEEEEEVS